MRGKIFQALGEFMDYMCENIGQPINLSTIGAFNKLVYSIIDALHVRER